MMYEEFDEDNFMVEDLLDNQNKNMEEGNFSFLTSNRFWMAGMTSASLVLIDPSFSTQPWYVSLGKFLGSWAGQFIVIRTIDRASDKKVEAAKVAGQVTTVTMPSNISNVTATTEPKPNSDY